MRQIIYASQHGLHYFDEWVYRESKHRRIRLSFFAAGSPRRRSIYAILAMLAIRHAAERHAATRAATSTPRHRSYGAVTPAGYRLFERRATTFHAAAATSPSSPPRAPYGRPLFHAGFCHYAASICSSCALLMRHAVFCHVSLDYNMFVLSFAIILQQNGQRDTLPGRAAICHDTPRRRHALSPRLHHAPRRFYHLRADINEDEHISH